jgi:hypothetical protein
MTVSFGQFSPGEQKNSGQSRIRQRIAIIKNFWGEAGLTAL